MELLAHFTEIFALIPDPPTGTPAELAKGGIEFFSLWIARIGGIIAFIGAIKFALSIKDDNAKEQLLAVLIMVSGFMIKAAVSDLNIFNIPAVYTQATADAEFESILRFIGKWTRRVGALGMFLGAIMFGISFKDEPAAKLNGIKTLSAGAIVVAVSAILDTFV